MSTCMEVKERNDMKMKKHYPHCNQKESVHLYKIGMFANMNRVTIKTLRYYDEQKLLIPVYVDEENGYRYYEAGQMAELHRIIALKNMGFSIDDIRKIINGAEGNTLLLRKKQEILKEIALLTAKLAQVESYLAQENVDLTAPVLIKDISEVIVCTMEQRITSYDTLHKSYAMLLEYIEENGYEISGNIRESYIDGVWNKETEQEWLTEIQIPVRK